MRLVATETELPQCHGHDDQHERRVNRIKTQLTRLSETFPSRFQLTNDGGSSRSSCPIIRTVLRCILSVLCTDVVYTVMSTLR